MAARISGASRRLGPSSNRRQIVDDLDLVERSLVGLVECDPPMDPWSEGAYDAARREAGLDWPSRALTMIGRTRLTHLRTLCTEVLDHDVPGDLLEAGVWRGGACILMRALLAARGVSDRTVWCADSFAGLPPPDLRRFPADQGDRHHQFKALAVPLDEVRENFARYGLLDEQVRFLRGWFRDTLRTAPIERLALLRIDADMYGSTLEALDGLYDRLSPGGFVVVDDFGGLAGCRQAVLDFRRTHDVDEPLHEIDWTAVFWQKENT